MATVCHCKMHDFLVKGDTHTPRHRQTYITNELIYVHTQTRACHARTHASTHTSIIVILFRDIVCAPVLCVSLYHSL